MSRSVLLRRVAGLVSVTTAIVAAGPLVGTAAAVVPVLVSTSPADNAIVQPPATVSATYSIVLAPTSTMTVVGSVTPVPGTTMLTNGNKTVTFTPAAPLTQANSPYTVTVTAREGLPGTDMTTSTFDFQVDTTAPTLSDVAMSTPVTTSGVSRTNVTGKITENHPGGTINVSIDDAGNAGTPPVTASGAAPSGTNATWAINNIDVTSLSDGTLTATVTATDAAGNSSGAATATAVKDSTGPTLVSSTPADEARVQTRTTVIATYNEALDTANSTMVVTNTNGTPLAGVTSFSNGNKTITFTSSSPLNEAGSPYEATITAKDVSGNTTTTLIDFVVDDTPPGAPSVTLADPINNTNKTAAQVSGTAEPGSTVNISVDDSANVLTVPVTTTAPTHATTGAYATTVNVTTLDDGTLTATVTATDVAGNTGAPGTDTATKDTAAPSAPTVTITTDPINNGNKTAVSIGGGAEPGATVNVSVDDAGAPGTSPVTASTTADGMTGAWSLTVNLTGLNDGTVTATATATDTSGNAGPAALDTATKDTGVPAAPTADISPKPVNNANKSAITISGTTEPNTSVTYGFSSSGGGGSTSIATSDGSGNFTETFDFTSIGDGTITAFATATDAAGNTSPQGTTTTIKDVVAPGAPSVVVPAFVNSANRTAVPVSGTAEAGSTVTVVFTDAGVVHTITVTATANGMGDWSTTANLSTLNDGAVGYSATTTDPAGNVSGSATTGSVTKDTAAPGAPTVTLPNVTQANQAAVPLSGTAEPASTVSLSVNDTDSGTTAVTGSTTTDGMGNWTKSLDLSSLAEGTLTATATATDAAGNTGPSDTDTAVKDTITLALMSTSPIDGATVQSPATVSGTFNEPVDTSQSSLVVRDQSNGVVAGPTTFSNGNKTITFTPSAPLSQAGSPYTATFVGKDFSGDVVNTSTTFNVDNSAPSAPSVNMTNPVNAANKTAVTVSGVAEPASSVLVSVDDTDSGTTAITATATANGMSGAYTTTLNLSSLTDGTLTATVTATDSALNTSPPGTASSTKDTLVPATPTITMPDPINAANDQAVIVSGTAEVGSSIAVTVVDADVASATNSGTVPGTGEWTFTFDLSGFDDGLITASAVATDAAQNPSTTATDTSTKDATAPGTPSVAITDPVNNANKTAITVAGVAEPGSTVGVVVGDQAANSVGTSTTAHAMTGAYSIEFNVTGLNDGTLTAIATATDTVGNTSGTGTDTATKDTVNPGTPTVVLTDPITRSNVTSVTVTGTAEPGSVVGIVVDDSDSGTTALTDEVSAHAMTGAYSATFDVTSLTDGTITATAGATDAVGNTSPNGSDTAPKNTTRAVTIAGLTGTPVSGTQYDVTVTVHQTFDDESLTDTTYTGTPVLTAPGDTNFTGTCTAAVAGVAACNDIVFGDLGAATLTATAGDDTGTQAVTVQPTGLVFNPAPPTTGTPGTAVSFTVVPQVGVVGATITDYAATRTLHVGGGGSTPADGATLTCPNGSCTFGVTFASGGTKTVSVTDSSTPSRSTPTATVTLPHPTALSIARSTATLPYGGTVTISGRLSRTSNNAGVPSQTIRIYARTLPGTTYKLVKYVPTNANGLYSTKFTLTQSTIFQAIYPATTNFKASSSPLIRVDVRTLVLIQSPRSGTSIPFGSILRVTGYCKPLKPGQLVYLVHVRANGTRAVLQTIRISSDGVFRFARSGLGRGTYNLYVLTGNSTANVGGQSATFQVRIT